MTERDTQLARVLLIGLLGLSACVTIGHLLWYSATPLGLYPVLDSREILTLAGQWAKRQVSEPIYRAPLYPALLSALIRLEVAPSEVIFWSRLLNGVLHVITVGLIYLTAKQVWSSATAALIAGVLYAAYPVALFFAADLLDVTLAMTLMAAGIYAAIRATESAEARWFFFATVLFVLAAFARPQMYGFVGGWVLYVIFLHRKHFFTVFIPALVLVASFGVLNYSLSGEFRVMPWQGAYNLWAANHPDSNGRYLEQSREFTGTIDALNPARADAEQAYRRARPQGPFTIDASTSYWRLRTVEAVLENPLGWARLLAAKFFYLVNQFEQYNNKTYSYHKGDSPWLAWNPLSWGMLLLPGVLGLVMLSTTARGRLLALLVISYVGVLMLTFVSARFRLPLVPILCVLAGGALFELRRVRKRWISLAVVLVLGVLSFYPLEESEVQSTYVQDELLLARASLNVSDLETANLYLTKALNRVPGHRVGLELQCLLDFNTWIKSDEFRPAVFDSCHRSAMHSRAAQNIIAYGAWARGDREGAFQIWRHLAQGDPPMATALAYWVAADGISIAAAREFGLNESDHPELVLSFAWKGDPTAAQELEKIMTSAERAKEFAVLDKLFGVK